MKVHKNITIDLEIAQKIKDTKFNLSSFVNKKLTQLFMEENSE